MTIRRIILVLTLVSFLCPAGAQEKPSFFRRTIESLAAPSVELDPEAVYQPKAGWTFALTGELRQALFSQHSDFVVRIAGEEGSSQETPIMMNTTLRGDVHKVLGFQAGYGNLSLSLSKKLGGGGENSTFAFDYMDAGYALQLQYFKYNQPIDYFFAIGWEGTDKYMSDEGVSNEPGMLKALIADAMYFFNRRAFSYSSAYRGNKIQRRSAGSWMFGTKVILSDYNMDPAEDFVSWSGGQARQSSSQVSFGGGYSYNFVPLHRHPYGDRDKGLRNITVNVTAMPLVTLFNLFSSTIYEFDIDENDNFVFEPVWRTRMNGKLKFNYVLRAGIGYCHDLYSFNISTSYDSFGYLGETVIVEDDQIRDMDTVGEFSRWNVSLRIGKRF